MKKQAKKTAEKKNGRGRSTARALALSTLPAGNGGKATAKARRAARGKSAIRNPPPPNGACGRRGVPRGALRQSAIPPALAGLAVPIGQLHPDPENARRHDERGLAAITASLQRFGQQAPAVYVVRKGKKIIIKGNGVLQAAKALGWKSLAAVESGLAAREAMAYAIADNRTTDLSDFDEKLLAAQLAELELNQFDLTAVGFTEAELQDLLEDVANADGGDGDGGEGGQAGGRKRGERTALVVVGHLKFELPRVAFDRWLAAVEAKVGNDPDRVVAEIKRRLKL